VLSNLRQHADRQVVGVRHIGTDKLHPAFPQIGQKGDIPAEPIQLGDHERGARHLGAVQRVSQLWPIARLPLSTSMNSAMRSQRPPSR
jgi:hypothetical protein